MGSSFGQKIINISMDVEDVYGDVRLLNSQLFDLIDFFNETHIPVDIYVSGIRFSTILFENEKNIQKLISEYSNLGYHSNTHSFYPIPTLTEVQISNNEEHLFSLQKRKFDYSCKGGICDFEKYFSTEMFRCPGLCWTPDYFEYMAHKGFNLTTIDIQYSKPFGYMGLFVLPTNEKPLEAYQLEQDLSQDIEKYEAVSLYFHPARLLYNQFWDKTQERSIYSDSKNRLERLKEMIISLSKKYHIASLKEIKNYYVAVPATLQDKNEISMFLEKSLVSKWNWSQLPKNFYNPYHIEKCREEFFTIVSYKRND